jgi:uncharacterized protein YkwD
MPNHAYRRAIASLFLSLAAACGGGDEGSAVRDAGTDQQPQKSCTTLENLPCGCPGGGYGKYACDGSCLACAMPQAGMPGLAGRGAAGSGTIFPGTPGRGGVAGSGVAGPAGAPAPAPAGMSAPPPVAGSAAPPAAGAPAMQPPAAGGAAPVTTGDVPEGAVCEPVAMWSAEWSMFEQEVLRLVNENRAKGWNCDAEGMFPAAGPLTMNANLRCSARLHSKDMADRMYFAHDNPDGENPGQRMMEAGYVGRGWGENIAKGQRTPAEVVQGWMDSDGHCSNIMNAMFNQIGVGYFAGMAMSQRFNSELYWTQNFGVIGGGGGRR